MKYFQKISLIVLILISQNVFSQNLSKAVRLFELSKIWSEITYNYPKLDRLNFDFDSLYLETIKKIDTCDSDLQYYEILNEFICSLHDGHTFIIYPKIGLKKYIYQIYCTYTHGKVYVTSNVANNAEILPVGTEIVSINNIPVLKYIDSVLYPKFPIRQGIKYQYLAEQMLFYSETDSVLYLKTKSLDGTINDIKLSSVDKFYEWNENYFSYPYFKSGLLEVIDDNSLYVYFSDFTKPDQFDNFCKNEKLLEASNGLIIDLRHAGGGANYGYKIYKYFTKDTMCFDNTHLARIHNSSKKASGMLSNDQIKEFLGIEKSNNNYNHYEDWTTNKMLEKGIHVLPLKPASFTYDKPVIVLIDERTGSASEALVVELKAFTNLITVGTPSYGAATLPLLVPLSNRAMFRVASQIVLNHDESEFEYLIPDVFLEPTIEQILNKNDTVLNYSILKIKELSCN